MTPLLIAAGAAGAYLVAGWVLYVPHAVAKDTEKLIREWNAKASWYAMRLSFLEDHTPNPAPVAELRREAARHWPTFCLIWLPALVAALVARSFDTITDRAAGRAPRTRHEHATAAAAQRQRLAEIDATVARVEADLKTEFGISFEEVA